MELELSVLFDKLGGEERTNSLAASQAQGVARFPLSRGLNSGTKYERSERFSTCFRRLRRETLPRVTHSRDVCGATPSPVTSSNAVSYPAGRCEVREDADPVGEEEVAFTIMDSKLVEWYIFAIIRFSTSRSGRPV